MAIEKDAEKASEARKERIKRGDKESQRQRTICMLVARIILQLIRVHGIRKATRDDFGYTTERTNLLGDLKRREGLSPALRGLDYVSFTIEQ